jgi:membrane protease YdiL (CAAX protease family)
VAVGKSWANIATWIVGGVAAWGIVGTGGLDLTDMLVTSKVTAARFAIDAGAIVTGVAAAGFLFRSIRKDVATLLPIDPDNPVHALALVLAVILFGTQVTSLVFTDVLGSLSDQPPQTLLDIFLDELPLLAVALAGVGVFVRRSALLTAERLGLVRPAWWHIVVALASAGVFLAVLQGFDVVNHNLLPEVARRVDSANSHLFSELATAGWVGAIALAVLPGVCEELLFRGALQPRIGLVPTALLFTSIHTQYGISIDLAGIFVVALGLGLIRKYLNTTTSVTVHVTYNLLTAISLGGAVLYAALGVEAVLIAVAAYAIWVRMRRPPEPAAP